MIFELYYSWYEDYVPLLFEHTSKTHKEWERDCKKALKECGKDYIEQEDSWISPSQWMSFACETLELYEYKRIQPVKFGYQGSDIIGNTTMGKGVEKGKDDLQWGKVVGKKLLAQALEKNGNLDKTLYEDMRKMTEDIQNNYEDILKTTGAKTK